MEYNDINFNPWLIAWYIDGDGVKWQVIGYQWCLSYGCEVFIVANANREQWTLYGTDYLRDRWLSGNAGTD